VTKEENIAAEMSELVILSLDKTITPEKKKRLNELIVSNPKARKIYLDCLSVQIGLKHISSISINQSLDIPPQLEQLPSEMDGIAYLEELVEQEKNGKAIEVEETAEPVERVLTEEECEAKIRAFLREEKAIDEQERRLEEEARCKIRRRELRRRQRAHRARTVAAKVKKYSTIGAMAAVGMVLAFYLYALLMPVPPASVAKLTDGLDIKWADPGLPTELDGLLGPGLMKLEEGYVEITFDEGARIILEAPTEINLEKSNRAFLKLGKLSADVPIQARGFKIDTPTASIVDIGTEFGLHVKEDGSSDIHVFKGKISLLAGKIDDMVGNLLNKVEQIVEAGQARRVIAGSSKIQDIHFVQTGFVKTMPLPNELAVRKNDPAIYYRFNEKEEILSDTFELGGRAEIVSVGLDLGKGSTNCALKVGQSDSFAIFDGPFQGLPQKAGTLMMWIWYEQPDDKEDNEFNIFSTMDESHHNVQSSSIHADINDKLFFEYVTFDEDSGELSNHECEIMMLKPARWYHIAITFDRHNTRVYINGNKVGEHYHGSAYLGSWDKIYLGTEYYDLEVGFISGTVIMIDELAIYTQPLSPREIEEIYWSANMK